MNCITVTFEKQEEKYTRTVTFPDGTCITEQDVQIKKEWHSPEKWPWIKPLYEYSRDELVKEGNEMAHVLFGQQGCDFVATLQQNPQDNQTDTQILILEHPALPEIARMPWEIACLGSEFICTQRFIPIIRRPQRVERMHTKTRWLLHDPLKLLLVSASPKDETRLQVENELLKAAYALEEPMANHRVIVDEVLNCTREKLCEILRCNVDFGYDILYFTGHGYFDGQTGHLLLEHNDGTADLVSANDVVSLLRRQQETLALVFLNCCDAATVGSEDTTGKNGFGDVARKILHMGVPHVVATQASIYDDTGRTAMKTFFEELGQVRFEPTRALLAARAAVDNDQNPNHDFYHYVHLSTFTGNETWDTKPLPKVVFETPSAEEKAAHRSEHYLELDKNFVGRFEYISRIEEAWWTESTHVVGLHGLGGIGKTYLCSRMEQRVLFYAVPEKRLVKCIFIDFREGTGHTLGLFLNQLMGIAHDLGYAEYEKVVEENDTYPTPLEKLREFRRWLDTRYGGKVLLVLDNLESALDDQGVFRDEELGRWFRLLLGQTSKATKILVTCRFRFEFFPDGRDIVEGRWLHLGEFGYTERLCFLDCFADLRNKTWEEKKEIMQAAGGHPYLLKMVLKYVQRNRKLPEAILKASKEIATYARLDAFLSLLSPDALEWLVVAAVFPEPRSIFGIINTRAIRDGRKDGEVLEKSLQQATDECTKLSLAAVEGNEISIDPLLVFQLLDNEESSFRQTKENIEALRHAVGQFFLALATQTEEHPQRVSILRLGVETVLAQEDMELIIDYLHECADVFYGFVPASLFASMVGRVEKRLFAKGDERSFHTIAFCAITLKKMRLFSKALALYLPMLSDSRLPDKFNYAIYFGMGNVYFEQRQWDPALENYHLAIQWSEKTGDHIELGGVYHQIGMVYQEQRQWNPALENYHLAIQWSEKTGNHVILGSTFHQIGRVYTELHQWELALENLQQAIQWKEKTGDHVQLGSSFHQIGIVYTRQRQWEHALENYYLAIQWHEKTGNHVELGVVYHQLGRVYQEQHQWELALKNYQQALQWKEKTGNHVQLGSSFHQIGMVYSDICKWGLALENYHQAIQWKEKTGNHVQLGSSFHQVGNVYFGQGKWDAALENYHLAIQWNEKTGNHFELGVSYYQIGMVYEKQEDIPNALSFYKTGIFFSLQNANQNDIILNVKSLARIFPKLSGEQIETLKNELGEEFVQEIQKIKEATDFSD